MLPANIVSALQVLANTGKQQATVLKDAPQPVTKLEPGQELQGTVQSKVNEGVFKVQVAGQTLQMRLPGNIQSGDTIRLQVVSLLPKITFGLIASTNPISTPEQIGSAARMLGNLANMPLERPVVEQLGSKAVWSTAEEAPDTKQLAVALREALGKSGLFYESHQAQWIRGERSTNQLLEEPQNLLTGRNLPPPSAEPTSTADKSSSAQAQSATQVTIKSAVDASLTITKGTNYSIEEAQNLPPGKSLLLSSAGQNPTLNSPSLTPAQAAIQAAVNSAYNASLPFMKDLNFLPKEQQNLLTGKNLPLSSAEQNATINKYSLTQSNAQATVKPADDTSLPIAKELIPLVQQQLHTLEQHHMVWMGQVWPGQQMQWEIQGEPEHQGRQQDERQWSTEMELTLPKLGDIHARLVFAGDGLRLTLRAADSTTANLFSHSLPNLKNSLEDAGLSLAAAVVEKS